VGDPTARALYLYPTKALAQDQARSLQAFGLTRHVRPAIYDGDTLARNARDPQAQQPGDHHPDMLHVGILPHHTQWADLLANLAFVW